MIGANAIFHLGSLIAVIWLIVVLMRLRGDREMLRQLTVAKQSRQFFLSEPGKFLARVCRAVDVPFEEGSGHGKPRKIEWGPWRELFAMQRIKAVRWQDTTPSITLQVDNNVADQKDWEERLSKASGGDIDVTIETVHE